MDYGKTKEIVKTGYIEARSKLPGWLKYRQQVASLPVEGEVRSLGSFPRSRSASFSLLKSISPPSSPTGQHRRMGMKKQHESAPSLQALLAKKHL